MQRERRKRPALVVGRFSFSPKLGYRRVDSHRFDSLGCPRLHPREPAEDGTLYSGSTTDLARRVWENRTGVTPGFTKTYSVTSLVWYEAHERIIEARIREYAIKRWRRDWKLALIEAMNPDWRDLYLELNQ